MATDARTPEAPVDEQFTERWSPRAFRSEPLAPEDTASLFEAARWSPSCFNEQPWLFVWGTEPADRERILGLLMEGNRSWAAAAPLLGVVFARRRFEVKDRPDRWAEFDSGAASFALALQARKLGLAAHFMGGFDEDATYAALGPPREDWVAMAAFAVGRPGDPESLPEPLRERERPNGRKSLAEIAHEGTWKP